MPTSLKGHSQLWDRADLDTSFLTLKKVHPNLESKFIWKSAPVFAFFSNLLLKNLFLSVILLILWYRCYHICIKTVFIPIYYISVICQISYEMVSYAHVRRLTVSL